MVRVERGQLDEAEELLNAGLRIATEEGDPETASWTRGSLASVHSMRGELEAGIAMARRNCELTERLGDVFSQSLALANLGAAQLTAEDYAAALASLEEAERLYRGAMTDGGEMEAWRAALRADALNGVGRTEEAIEVATWASEIARERGMHWALPLALWNLGRALEAAGREGAQEAFDEAVVIATETKALRLLAKIEADREALAAGAR